jgi:hypothetical protein
MKSNNFSIVLDSKKMSLKVQGLDLSSTTVNTSETEFTNEHDIFHKLGLSNAHSNSEMKKYLPENLIDKLEKTFLGKRASEQSPQLPNKR